MHPIERLRYVARAGGVDQGELVREAAAALSGLGDDPGGLIMSCRRLLVRHPTAGALWFLCARLLTAGDVRAEAWAATEELEHDGTPGHLARLLPDEATQFLGPYAKEFLTFADPDRRIVDAFGLTTLPALVHVRQDLSVAATAEGWEPQAWREVTDNLSKAMGWTRPVVPAPTDPRPFPGTSARG
jgi:hypothetical protein